MPVVTASLAFFTSTMAVSLDSSMSKELIVCQTTSKTLEVSAHTVRYSMGSIVPGSMEPPLEWECILFIDICELERRMFVTGWRPASSSTAFQWTPDFCMSILDSSILKSRDQEKTKLLKTTELASEVRAWVLSRVYREDSGDFLFFLLKKKGSSYSIEKTWISD